MRIVSSKILYLAVAMVLVAGTLFLPETIYAATGQLTIGGYNYNLGEDKDGPGWDWNADTNTLTLDSDYTEEEVQIQYAADDTTYINYSGNVTIKGKLWSDGPIEINCTGSETDVLSVSNDRATILTPKDLVIKGGTISSTSTGNSAFHVRGSFHVLGNASIIAKSWGTGSFGIVNPDNTTTINTTGSVEITSDSNNIISGTLNYISGALKTNGTLAIPPAVSGLSDVSIDEGNTITRNVNLGEGYLKANSYSVESKDTDIVAVETSDSTFTIKGMNYGTSEVIITWNGSGLANQTIAMNVTVNSKPSVSSITVPNAVNVGAQLSLDAPTVNENGYAISSQGWEISTDGDTNWTSFDPTTPMTLAHNGKHLRYFATNALGTGYSNIVMTAVNAIRDAQTPVFSIHPQSASYKRGSTAATLTVTAGVTDDGTLSYQWYENTKNNNLDGTAILDATAESYTPNINAKGTTYYYCVVTNENITVNGTQIVKAASNVAVITVKSTSSGSSSSETIPDTPPTLPVTILPYTQPNQPTVGSVTGKMKEASFTITDTIIKEILEKAAKEAKAQNRTAYGIGAQIVLDAPTSGLTVTLEQSALNRLASLEAKSFELTGLPITLTLDTHALEDLKKQNKGDLTIAVKSVTVEGVSNSYDITLNTVKNGKNTEITSVGSATLAIPYTPNKDELEDNLYAVYMDDVGNIHPVANSFYNANSGTIIFSTDHFSVYGVGYEAPRPKFIDIDSHWAKTSIEYTVNSKLLSGTSESSFSPDIAMTRGMLVTALGRLAGVDTTAYTASSFTDVDVDTYYAPYIQWAYSKGIVQGIGDNQFAPDRAVTRQEIAVVFANFAKITDYALPENQTPISFTDASDIGDAYMTSITAMQQAGIMIGERNNRFNPTANATRAETCVILYRYIMLIPPVA